MRVCTDFLIMFQFLMINSEKYGTDRSQVPRGVPNFIYGANTGNSNLRRHLKTIHAHEYDQAIVKYNWKYKLSTHNQTSTTQSTRSQRDRRLPSFSPTVFLELLVRFIVADDQVSSDDLWVFFALSQVFSRFVS